MTKISSIVYGTIIASLFVVSFGKLIADLHANYDTKQYNSTDIEIYNKLDQIYDNATQLYEDNKDAHADRGIVDILGDLIVKSINALKTTWQSFDLFQTMSRHAAKKSDKKPYSKN